MMASYATDKDQPIMSIFSLAEPAALSFEALIAQCTKLRLAEQQAMITDVEALLGKLAAPKPVTHATVATMKDAVALMMEPGAATVITVAEPVEAPAPKPRRGRKRWHKASAAEFRRRMAIEELQPKLNAVGKPYSPQYDPKYRMKYRTPKIGRQPSSAASSAAATYYRAAIEARYPGDTALVNEICARNGA